MITPAIPINENERLDELKDLSILDTLPEDAFDEITEIASQICGTKISLVSLVDQDRQWFKSRHGLDAEETPRDIAFCAHAINQPDELFIIENSLEDERFHDNPLVTQAPNVIFYAGMPLKTSTGNALGTLCVIDDAPRKLTEQQKKSLDYLGNQVVRLFELRKKTFELEKVNSSLSAKCDGLDKFARIAAHDMKSPLSSIIGLLQILEEDYGLNLDNEGRKLLSLVKNSATDLSQLIEGILTYCMDLKVLNNKKETINVRSELLKEIDLLKAKYDFTTEINVDENFMLFTNKVAFKQIASNLLSNGLKYNEKENKSIKINLSKVGNDKIKLSFIDNGNGIPQNNIDEIFKLFKRVEKDKNKQEGHGVGLATVKSIIENLGGYISVRSKEGFGSSFDLTLLTK